MNSATAVPAWAPGPVSGAVGAFAATATWSSVPEPVRSRIAPRIAEVLVDATLSAGTPLAEKLAAYVLEMARPPEATVLVGTAAGHRTGARDAAMVNAAAAGTQHLGLAVPVVAAAVAAAELVEADGDRLLVAVAVGAEVAARVAVGLGARHERRGWDPLGTAGRMGAGAAVARLLALPDASVVDALGYAATCAAGTRQPRASMGRALVVAKAAADGVEAGLCARAGLAGPPSPIEGRRGLFALEAGEDPGRIVDGLGIRWELTERLPASTPRPMVESLARTIDRVHGDPAAVISACREGASFATQVVSQEHHDEEKLW